MLPGRYVYHGAPPQLVGHHLVSLYGLEAVDPIAFRRELAKYDGRESAPAFIVPGLGRRFNDTVHCAPIHPWYIAQARLGEGLTGGPMVERTTYRIPVSSITVSPVVWYSARTLWVNGAPGEEDEVPAEPPADEFEPFDSERYSELTAVPAAYRARIRDSLSRGRRPLMFVHIPHVLVAGAIDLSGAEVVDPLMPPDWET